MKRGFILIFYITYSMEIIAGGHSHNLKGCDKWSYQDWDLYIGKVFSDVLPPVPGSLHFDLDFTKKNKELSSLLKSCANAISKKGLWNCLKRPFMFTVLFEEKNKNRYSYFLSNKEYYKSQPEEKMQLPLEFKNSPYGLPKNWREISAKNGWKWIFFQTQLSDKTSRLVIQIDKKDYQVLLLYEFYDKAKSDDLDLSKIKLIDMQVVEYKKNGKILDKPLVHFREWNDFSSTNKKPILAESVDSCIKCHPAGPRAIYPKENPTHALEMSKNTSLTKFNDAIVLDSAVDWKHIIDPLFFPSKITIGSKGGCTDCHDGETRNSLSLITDDGKFAFNTFHDQLVMPKQMPPMSKPDELTYLEREEIFKSMQLEYYKKLREWILEFKCSSIEDERLVEYIENLTSKVLSAPKTYIHQGDIRVGTDGYRSIINGDRHIFKTKDDAIEYISKEKTKATQK